MILGAFLIIGIFPSSKDSEWLEKKEAPAFIIIFSQQLTIAREQGKFQSTGCSLSGFISSCTM